MVTGASTADLAVILIDARKGVLTQTRRHSYLVSAARHPPRRAGGEQDGPGRLRPGGVRRDRRRLPRVRRADRHRRRHRHPDVGAARATTSSSRSADDALVRRPDADRASRDASTIEDDAAARGRSGCRCSGSTARTRTSAASPGTIASGSGHAGRRGRASLPSGRDEHASRASSRCDGDLDAGGRRPVGDADAGRRDRLSAAATCIAAADDAARGRRPVRGDARLDGRRAAAARPRLLAEARHAARSRDGHRARSTRSTSTRWSIWRPRRWS